MSKTQAEPMHAIGIKLEYCGQQFRITLEAGGEALGKPA
jgi:hypothetical protein